MANPKAVGINSVERKFGNPLAQSGVGGGNQPAAGSPNLDYLPFIAKSLQALEEKLAPDSLLLELDFNAVAARTIKKWPLVPASFNNIIASLSAGTVNIYLSDSPSGRPAFTFYGGTNPVQIQLPMQYGTQICAQVDAASASAATGKIYLAQY